MEARTTAREGAEIPMLNWLLGKPIPDDRADSEHIGPATGVAVLGLDALSSAAYGPEAALTLLIPLGAAGLAYALPLTGIIAGVLVLVFLSYRQTIRAYPDGGGSYTVAKENLGAHAALVAGAALALDYILNVAVGISAGVGALVSIFPDLVPHRLLLCLVILSLLTIANLRGVRESGVAFMLPTWTFVISLFGILALGVWRTFASGGHPVPVESPPPLPLTVMPISAWIIVRAFASGCTALTGVEAVSNGVPIFRKPTIANANRTLSAIVGVLLILLLGVAFLCRTYGIAATDPEGAGYRSVLSMLIAAIVGRGPVYFLTMASVVTVLALSANTSFADFPRLCRALAEDRYLPDAFAVRGRRLVFTQGILLLALLAALLLVAFKGITDNLIPLFAVGAFLAFTVSQIGMDKHWRREDREARLPPALNALGAVATGATLLVVVVSKFTEGAWMTVVILPLMVLTFIRVNRHYLDVAAQVAWTAPLTVEPERRPAVLVAAQAWNKMTLRAVQFALRLSDDVTIVQVRAQSAKMRDLTAEWQQLVADPVHAAGLPEVKLQVLTSNYRQFFTPLVDYVLAWRNTNPDREIVVVLPDLIVKRWYHGILHNHRGAILRTLLRLRGGPNVVIVNTPFYLQ